MKIHPIRSLNDSFCDFTKSTDVRKIGYYSFHDCLLGGRNLCYPNLLLFSNNTIISPYDERVMSLQCDSFYENNEYTGELPTQLHLENNPVFFFALNVDNYFHFLYDSLPYLFYYFEIKKQIPECRVLLQTSHPSKKSLPQFVLETLQILGIHDFLFVQENTLYKDMYVGLSMTHGGASSKPPNSSAYKVWDFIRSQSLVSPEFQFHPKIYISRRSWLSKHPENIGTNYTTRRKCLNEDELVEFLMSKGFVEVFCEDLSMAEKVALFANAEEVAGVIGGGMANSLFCKPSCKVHCFLTPGFIEINARFEYSMKATHLLFYEDVCSLAPHHGSFSLYTRAKILDTSSEFYGKIGEICEFKYGSYKLQVSKEGVAGFSQDFQLDSCWIAETNLAPLDKGLNSPYVCSLERLKQSF